jgi:trans-aconitate 2-methyltransferase
MDTTWNPDLYLKFRKERTQPSVDLVARIELANPESIIDIGCGPGNSTRVLWERWPDSQVLGLDSSPPMIDKASAEYPGRRWKLGDARELPPDESFDLVFSNATIQWIPDHTRLIPHLVQLVRPGGALAVQIPLYREMPVYDVIATVSAAPRWKQQMEGCDERWTFHGMGHYYDLVAPMTRTVSMWQTWYAHEMESHQSIVQMMSSTGMRQFLDRLGGEDDKAAFSREVLAGLREAYPEQKNGRVLYPFKRLFWIAYK